MIKRLIIISVFIFCISGFSFAEDRYFPTTDDHKYRLGSFWGSITFGSYIPLDTLSDNLNITSGGGVGFTFFDIFGIDIRGAYQRYDATSMIFGKSGLVPNDTPGNEVINKIDGTAYLIIQPAFKVGKNVAIAPYVGIGGDFSFISYAYSRDTPRFTYETTMTVFGVATKAGLRFRFSNMLIGAGVEYIYAVPSNFYNIDFSSLTYSLEVGFIL